MALNVSKGWDFDRLEQDDAVHLQTEAVKLASPRRRSRPGRRSGRGASRRRVRVEPARPDRRGGRARVVDPRTRGVAPDRCRAGDVGACTVVDTGFGYRVAVAITTDAVAVRVSSRSVLRRRTPRLIPAEPRARSHRVEIQRPSRVGISRPDSNTDQLRRPTPAVVIGAGRRSSCDTRGRCRRRGRRRTGRSSHPRWDSRDRSRSKRAWLCRMDGDWKRSRGASSWLSDKTERALITVLDR